MLAHRGLQAPRPPAPLVAQRPERIQLPTPFPVGGVNAFYLPGAEPALVDVGTHTPAAWAELTKALDGRKVAHIVATHAHVDHFGQAAKACSSMGARLLAHELDSATIETFDESASRRAREYRDGLAHAGVPPAENANLWDQGRRFDDCGQSATVHQRLQEGDRLSLGDDEYEVLHAPGHTPGSLLLRQAEGEHTFTGDTILPQITPNALSVTRAERHALPTYLRTLHHLRELELGLILPGHRPAFEDHTTAIDGALRHAELRQQRILTILSQGVQTAYDVALALFRKIERKDLFLAISEVLGHLSVLEEEALVTRHEGPRHDAFEPTA
jgi:glyoxylase-like metal-dependent hydrolase (beta-lactamase superfamily II)